MNKSSQQASLMPLKRLLLLASLVVGCAENDEQSKQHNTEAQNLNSENTELAHSPEAAVDETATETVNPSLPSLAEEQINVETFTLKRGQTITHVLKEAGFSLSQIYALANDIRPHFDFKKIKSGTQFDVVTHTLNTPVIATETSTDTDIISSEASDTYTVEEEKRLRFATGYGELIEATLVDNTLQLSPISLEVRQRRFSKSFEISQSLYKIARQAEIPANVINSAILAMSHFVDFQREIRTGDKITLNFSQSKVQQDAHLFEQFSAPKKLVAIEFMNKKRRLSALPG